MHYDKTHINIQKERHIMTKEKIVLAYSGGLDTSVAIAWLKKRL